MRRLRCDAGRVSSISTFHRAFFVTEGGPVTGAIRRSGRTVEFSVGADDIVIVSAGVAEDVVLDSPTEAVEVTIDPGAADRFLLERMHAATLGTRFDRTTSVRHAELARLARRMLTLEERPTLGADVMQDALGTLFLATFVRDLGRVEIAVPGAGMSARRFADLVRYIQANLQGRILVSDLARAAGMSEDVLRRRLRRSTGRGAAALVGQLRAGRARDLLGQDDMSLAEISFACGYSDQAHLTRCFKRAFGQAPGAWRASRSRRPASSDATRWAPD